MTTCSHGHDLDADGGAYWLRDGHRHRRRCRTCQLAANAAWYAENKHWYNAGRYRRRAEAKEINR
ncbi:hypothetical protein AWC11_12040 [Mycobacterium interjectum]|nr:hypothetical protein AWC11_12040 [Mycobacterium interjectum]